MEDFFATQIKPIVDSIVFSIVGSAILLASFWVIGKILPFSLRKEIEEDENVCLGIIIGAIIIGLSMIISAAIQG